LLKPVLNDGDNNALAGKWQLGAPTISSYFNAPVTVYDAFDTVFAP